jgi:hypothetical protein
MTEQETVKNVPIATTYEGVFQLALTSRRGELMKAAKLPKPEDCTPEDIPALCQNIDQLNKMIGELISLVGEKEVQLKRAMEAHEIVGETFDNWESAIRSVKEARQIHEEFIEEIHDLGWRS